MTKMGVLWWGAALDREKHEDKGVEKGCTKCV